MVAAAVQLLAAFAYLLGRRSTGTGALKANP